MTKVEAKKNGKPSPGKKAKSKLGSAGLKGRVRKQKRKKKSIHSNTFEERQENIRKKEAIKQKKQQTKARHAAAHTLSSHVIDQVTTWAQNNPLHPSTIPKPTQEGIRSIGPFSRDQKTYKALLKSLPYDVTPQEIDDHFYRRKNVQISSIKLLVHRKTERCLGWGFLEFKDKLEYEKSLTQNFTLLKDRRILVEQCLRTFVPSKRKPQKLISYIPPKKLGPWKQPESELKAKENDDEIQIIDELEMKEENENELQTLENTVNKNEAEGNEKELETVKDTINKNEVQVLEMEVE
ncbi:hypothetical protein Anas_02173 [Armadillidium nasatum]|uniref:RRM domain-containing protein n=1 Tax=Armadillidium nasatum TaxID=96803 RepID=A0A5N5TIC1_9CRUS|nr:hypothetical protein Anas_02173 [Armadillidium nasatum]